MKLLHERLREVKEGQSWLTVRPYGDAFIMWRQYAEKLADEIERYYIPRPRFEDGEPMQWGELFRGYNGEECDLAAFTVSSDGHYLLNEYSGDCDFSLKSYSDFVKRPTPKVYDADDVEIKVGDIVYEVDDDINSESEEVESIHESTEHPSSWLPQAGKPFVKYKCGGWNYANEVTHERPVFDAYGERICKGDTVWRVEDGLEMFVIGVGDEAIAESCEVLTEIDGKKPFHYNGKELTHREPDSIQKIRDYLIDCGNSDPSGMYYEAADRLTSIMERGE